MASCKVIKCQMIFEPPAIAVLKELATFDLLKLEETRSNTWNILFLQELRNAVENDFAVSDYYLTFNAVGTIITGDATITAPFQSGASVYGNVDQKQDATPKELAEMMMTQLGTAFLESHKEVAEAIRQLQAAPQKNFGQRLGSVVLELGRSLQHGANTAAVLAAIAAVAPYFR